jgi:predicted nucleic acid-binding protein
VTADSDDDYLVALALAAGADGIVSGDKHLPS